METRDNINKGEVILYNNQLEVRLRDNTVWLTQKDMAGLFNTERSVVTKQIRNIFKAEELEEKSNVQNSHIEILTSQSNFTIQT